MEPVEVAGQGNDLVIDWCKALASVTDAMMLCTTLVTSAAAASHSSTASGKTMCPQAQCGR